jgi:hypothetical protein
MMLDRSTSSRHGIASPLLFRPGGLSEELMKDIRESATLASHLIKKKN